MINTKRLTFALALLAIIIGAAFLRFENLGQQSYWMDEGYTVNAVISGMQHGTQNWSEILDSGRTYFCPMYCAPTKQIVKMWENISGHPGPRPGIQLESNVTDHSNNGDKKLDIPLGTQAGVRRYDDLLSAVPFRLLSAIAGLLTVILFFFFAKKTFKDNRIALLTAFFTAFSYWQIAWSRQARWYTEYELFFWLALLFAYLATDDRRTSPPALSLIKERGQKNTIQNLRAMCYVLFAITSAALATLTHNLGYGLFAIIAMYLIIFSPRPSTGEGRVRVVITALKTILILACIILPIVTLEAATGFKFSHDLIAKVSFHYELPYYLNFYLRNYWFLIILSLYGFFSAPREQKKIYWLVFLPIIGYLIALSFLTDIVQYRYLFAPIAGLFITGAAGAIAIINAASKLVIARSEPERTTRQSHRFTAAITTIIIILIFFLSGEGIVAPKQFYSLESDPFDAARPSWVYTPQPNFNKAYDYIKNNLQTGDIVISSHPHFNKIFLNQPGYWIKYDYLGLDNVASTTVNDKEYYVGAGVVNNLDELKKLIADHHGYIVFDYMSQDGRIAPEIITYIKANAQQVFYDAVNPYSQIWVYKF